MDRMYSNSQAGAQQALNLAEIFLRGATRMLDLQSAAARAVLQTQGRSADELVRRSRDGMEQMGRTSDEMMQRARHMSEEAGREYQHAQAAQQAETSSASSGIITPGGEAAGTAEERIRARRNA